MSDHPACVQGDGDWGWDHLGDALADFMENRNPLSALFTPSYLTDCDPGDEDTGSTLPIAAP